MGYATKLFRLFLMLGPGRGSEICLWLAVISSRRKKKKREWAHGSRQRIKAQGQGVIALATASAREQEMLDSKNGINLFFASDGEIDALSNRTSRKMGFLPGARLCRMVSMPPGEKVAPVDAIRDPINAPWLMA
jgi:hypothetical protein